MIVEPAPRSSSSGERDDPSFMAVLQESKLARHQPHRSNSAVFVDLAAAGPAEAPEILEMTEIGSSVRSPHEVPEHPVWPKPALQRGRYSLRFLLWFTVGAVGAYAIGFMLVMGVLYLTDRLPFFLPSQNEESGRFLPAFGHGHGHGPFSLFRHHLAAMPPPQHLLHIMPPPPLDFPSLPGYASKQDPNAVYIRTGPAEDQVESVHLSKVYPFVPPPMAFETCKPLSGHEPVTVTKKVYREGFFALEPSLYGAGSVRFVRPASSRPPAPVPFAAEALDSGMGLPDTTQNSTKASTKPHHLVLSTPYNLSVSIGKVSAQADGLQDLYICPVKLPMAGSGVSAFTLEDGKLRPLIPHRDGGTIANLDITVFIPPEFPPSALGFRATTPPPLNPKEPPPKPVPPLVRFVGYVTSGLRSTKDRILSLMPSRTRASSNSSSVSAQTPSATSTSS